jgi:hypothetical protein
MVNLPRIPPPWPMSADARWGEDTTHPWGIWPIFRANVLSGDATPFPGTIGRRPRCGTTHSGGVMPGLVAVPSLRQGEIRPMPRLQAARLPVFMRGGTAPPQGRHSPPQPSRLRNNAEARSEIPSVGVWASPSPRHVRDHVQPLGHSPPAPRMGVQLAGGCIRSSQGRESSQAVETEISTRCRRFRISSRANAGCVWGGAACVTPLPRFA